MNLDLWFGRPWALHPAKFEAIEAVVKARIEGREVNFEAKKGASAAAEPLPYTVVDGVAVVKAYGTMSKRANMFMDISGGVSTELLGRDIKAALADPSVDALVLDIDSPGGSVDGTKDVADMVRSARLLSGGGKPIVAYANGLMASAAYWIGSAADAIVAGETAEVGSIGVRMSHVDRSAANEKCGFKVTHIYAGKYKTAGNSDEPLDEESKEYLQGRVDAVYTLFVDAVATNRGVSIAKALPWADGRVWFGAEAVEQGLADKTGTLTDAINLAREKIPMNKDLLKANHPEVYKAVLEEGKALAAADPAALEAAAAAAKEEGRTLGRAEGVAAETKRCLEILDVGGPLSLTKDAVKEGTEPGAFALKVLQAEREGKINALDRLGEDIPPPVDGQGKNKIENNGGGEGQGDFMAQARAYAKEKKVTLAEAVKTLADQNQDLHSAYLDNQEAEAKKSSRRR